MEEIVTIIGNTCLKHHDSGEASINREARLIIQALKEKGYEIIQVKNKTNSHSKCCNAIVVASIGDEGTGCYVCSKCNKPSDIIPVQSEVKTISSNAVLALVHSSAGYRGKFQKGDTAFVCESVKRNDFLEHILEVGKEVIIDERYFGWNGYEAYYVQDKKTGRRITEILLSGELSPVVPKIIS